MSTIDTARSDLETAIVLALSPKASGLQKRETQAGKKGWVRETYEMSKFVTDKDRNPTAFYAFDMSDQSQRIYSESEQDLVVNPYEVFRLGIETGMLMEDGSLKWSGVYPMKKPKGITAVTNKQHSWFAYHFRHIHQVGEDDYVKRPFAMATDGSVCLLGLMGRWKGFNARLDKAEIEQQTCLTISVFEDAIRASAYLATVQEHVKIMFPVGESAYKKFFAMRDGYKNTPSGKKNPILHWCSEHLRQRGDDGVSVVSKHRRGASKFVCGPMKLTIQENDGYDHLVKG